MDEYAIFLVRKIARAHRVTLIDYDNLGDGLLISSGSGLLMATMDACPRFRFAVDYDSHADVNWVRWMPWMSNYFSLFGFVGWFSITDPKPAITSLSLCSKKSLIYTEPKIVPGLKTLKDFIMAANSLC